MRAALVPAGADPFLNAYWIRNFRTWADSVDELHMAVCGPIPHEVIEYHRAVIESAGGVMHYIPSRTDHGVVLEYLYGKTKADTILFVENDAYVRKPEAIEECFRVVESGVADLVGCPRDGYATPGVLAAASARFGDSTSYWPCFLFARRSDLEATDGNFSAKIWPPGSDLFGISLHERGLADTFIWASYQLRANGVRVETREGHRMGGADIDHGAPWFHVGSLSQGHGNQWQNPALTPEIRAHEVRQTRGLPGTEMPRRVAWWQRAWESWDGGIPEYHREYGEGLAQYIEDFGVSRREVEAVRASSDYLITWGQA